MMLGPGFDSRLVHMMYNDAMTKLVAFDLDDTLAESKCQISDEMAEALNRLLQRYSVCVITGGNLEQVMSQVVDKLDKSNFPRVHLMPTCGTRYVRSLHGEWITLHNYELSAEESLNAINALETCAKELGLWEQSPHGDIIENRGSQITFSALGQKAPVELKKAWDPTGEKKNTLRAAVQKMLPNLEVRSGGSTSIDITMRGVDKAFGIQKLIAASGFTMHEILFVGDRLDPTGNDYPVKAMGIKCHSVEGPHETLSVIDSLLQTV